MKPIILKHIEDLLNEEEYHEGPTPPEDTTILWVDTSFKPEVLKFHDGLNWVTISGGGGGGASGVEQVDHLPTPDESLRGHKVLLRGKDGAAEVAKLTITSPPPYAGNVIITLDGVQTQIAVSQTDTIIDVATKIRNTFFSGWTTGGLDSVVTFTNDTAKARDDTIYSDNGTGALGTIETTTQGITPVQDRMYFCAKTISGTYQWIEIVDNNGLVARVDELENKIVYKVEIISHNGNVFKNGQIETTLEARVYHGATDITDTIDANNFRWKRVSNDPTGDDAWNTSNAGGKKSVVITHQDVYVRATFQVEILSI